MLPLTKRNYGNIFWTVFFCALIVGSVVLLMLNGAYFIAAVLVIGACAALGYLLKKLVTTNGNPDYSVGNVFLKILGLCFLVVGGFLLFLGFATFFRDNANQMSGGLRIIFWTLSIFPLGAGIALIWGYKKEQ